MSMPGTFATEDEALTYLDRVLAALAEAGYPATGYVAGPFETRGGFAPAVHARGIPAEVLWRAYRVCEVDAVCLACFQHCYRHEYINDFCSEHNGLDCGANREEMSKVNL